MFCFFFFFLFFNISTRVPDLCPEIKIWTCSWDVERLKLKPALHLLTFKGELLQEDLSLWQQKCTLMQKIMLSTGAERGPAVNISGVPGTACGREAGDVPQMLNQSWQRRRRGSSDHQLFSTTRQGQSLGVSRPGWKKNILPHGQHRSGWNLTP